MKKYDIFLFDADGTLYDFDRAEANALKIMFDYCGFVFSESVLATYKIIDTQIWESYNKNEIAKTEINTVRFGRLFDEIGVTYDAKEFGNKYQNELGKGAFLIDGALEICQDIVACDKQIFIVTNGFLVTQTARIKHSLIKDYISDFFVSEFVGFKKPDIRYFEYVLLHIPQVEKEKMLIVGDSLSADIAGGNNIGIDTCWFNKFKSDNKTDIAPTHEINDLRELHKFINRN